MDKKVSEKKQRLLTALEQGMVMVHLDARRPGVLVPVHLKQEAHLRLNFSYRFDPPDLSVGEWGIRATLSFGGERFPVAVPWSALFALYSHVNSEFWMYPDDMPPELVKQGLATAAREEVPPRTPLREVTLVPPVPMPAPMPVPSLADAPAEEVGAPPVEPDPEEPKPRSRGHLRIVK